MIRRQLVAHVEGLGSAPLFLAVPGNHDLVRPTEYGGIVRLARDWSTDARLREHFWTNEPDEFRSGIENAFKNWCAWWSGARPSDRLVEYSDGALPGDFIATVEVGETLVGIVGLNTAFLQLEAGELKGRLSLDARQVSALCPDGAGAWARKHDIAILMTHHPPEWFDRRGLTHLRDEIAPPGRFAVHLYGHQHETQFLWLRVGGSRPQCEVLGCSLFGLETWGDDVQRLHGYSVVEVDGITRRSLRMWPRRGLHQQGGGWGIAPDHSFALEQDEGTEAVSLGPSPRAGASDDTGVHADAESGTGSTDNWSSQAQRGWECDTRDIDSDLQHAVNDSVAVAEALFERHRRGEASAADLMAWVFEFGLLVRQIDPEGDDFSRSLQADWWHAQWIGGNSPQNDDQTSQVFAQYLGVARSLRRGKAHVVTRRTAAGPGDNWPWQAQRGWECETRDIDSDLQHAVNDSVAVAEALFERHRRGEATAADLMAWVFEFGLLVRQIDPEGDDFSRSLRADWWHAQWIGGNSPQNDDQTSQVFAQYLGVARSLRRGKAHVVTRRIPLNH
jgi:hypothetical protein